jgi:hypothetical protein
MAILRAGPWGNLSDSFQSVPDNTGADGLTLYPVNCAKTDWLSGQAWGAYYEAAGCCTPETISATFSAGPDTFTDTGRARVVDNCERYDLGGEHPRYTGYYWTLFIEWNGSSWEGDFFDYSPGSIQSDGTLDNGDACDPTGTYSMNYGTLVVT